MSRRIVGDLNRDGSRSISAAFECERAVTPQLFTPTAGARRLRDGKPFCTNVFYETNFASSLLPTAGIVRS